MGGVGMTTLQNFYPRSPCGERLNKITYQRQIYQFLSTLSLRRATRLGLLGWLRVLISIHALLAESDGGFGAGSWPRGNFYPRSPCGERHNLTQGVFNLFTFLSTLSLRRATASKGAIAGD